MKTKKNKTDEIVITREQLRKLIKGAIKSTYDSHKKLTPELIGSILKRFDGSLNTYLKDSSSQPNKSSQEEQQHHQ
jgi:hypothetical protein